MPARLDSRGLALAAVGSLSACLVAATLAPTQAAAPARSFSRVATYPVFQNVPAGVDPADETVAEISAASKDGETVVYTDSPGDRIGLLDISDPGDPAGIGTLDVGGEPTSVAVVGDYVLAVIDTSPSYTEPSGRLEVIRLSDREPVHSIELGGQPDSIAISPDGMYAAIAMENERDEELAPEGGDEGDLPQAPSGFVQVVELGGDPTSWAADPVELPASALSGMDTPEDAEPEYGDINDANQLALTLQENNGLVVIDLPSREIASAVSLGEATVEGVDTDDDKVFDFSDTITEVREPDSVQWVGDGLVATANEGDWKGGSRGWSVIDAATGDVVWDAGASFEELATSVGLFNNGRADNKGAEPEGLAFAEYGATPYAFVGSERSNFVAVYDMTDPTSPALEQVLPTTNGPEGLLPIPGRNLFVVSSEEDNAEAMVRASVGVYEFGKAESPFPSIVSAEEAGKPIGWGALGALSGDPRDADRLWAASDAAYKPGRIYSIDTEQSPALLDRVVEVTSADGTKPAVDIEGLAARSEGGFWLAVEGATGAANTVLRTDADGVIRQTVALPDAVASRLSKWGLEGTTVAGRGAKEIVYVALQRPLTGESAARIGRYQVATGTWTWYGYPLETTSIAGDWIGLSEVVAVDDDTLAVIERDKQAGASAAVKRVYTVDVSGRGTTSGAPAALEKSLAVDVLPQMEALNGWTQEKLEGLCITGAGQVYAVTDNDGLDDATGETQLLPLGDASSLFR